MGFALFTSSGTFNPSTYGLSPGDLIHIKCVGGGAGGGGYNYSGYLPSAGQASSFGSILSAAGGSVPSSGNFNPVVDGSDPGGPGNGEYAQFAVRESNTSWTYYLYGCGVGGGGWHPQYGFVPSPPTALPFIPILPIGGMIQASTGSYTANISLTVGPQVTVPNYTARAYMLYGRQVSFNNSPTATASTLPYGFAGGGAVRRNENSAYRYFCMSAGGVGYGAGGGGGCYDRNDSYSGSASPQGNGGNGGVIADLDYVLPNSNSVTITVGNGGAGCPRYGSGNDVYTAGGGGARGCVAIWW